MADFDLLNTVQPEGGYFAIVGIKSGSVRQVLVPTREEADEQIEKFFGQDRDVYFGVAKYRTDESRKKDNVLALKALWLDLDCGESKAAVDEATGRPGGYLTQTDAIQALKQFCKTTRLPRPILVNSGRGIHAYWPLEGAVTREEWEPVAAKLHQQCVEHDLYVDASVFECARILRVPGTSNFKDTPPTLVSVISTAPAVGFNTLKAILGVEATKRPPVKRELTELAKSLQNNIETSFKKIARASLQDRGCNQIKRCLVESATLPEPSWFDVLSIAKFCVDADKAIHKISENHPDYDPVVTEQKIQHIVGPHTCAQFERNNPGGCDGCPFFERIKSPIVLGKEIAESDTEALVMTDEAGTTTTYAIPTFPFPFYRGKTGGIYMRSGDPEVMDSVVYEHDLFVEKRMHDPIVGDVVVLKHYLPKDGMTEFVVPNSCMMDKSELRKELATHGVLTNTKQFNDLMHYLILATKDLQIQSRAEKMRLQFGWAEHDSKFIIGNREITKDGTFHSPPSVATANIAAYLTPIGDFDKWKEVFNLYGRPGLEPHAFAALTAFGSPLLKFLGQNGAVINVIHPKSGTGKTTILHMCNSVYGHPEKLAAMWDDTLNAKIMRLGIMNNLPFTVDEMTNTTPAEFSTLTYSMSQGRGKDRVKASSNELRTNLTSWQSISLCSSNASFYEKLASLKAAPDGEMMRLIEYKIDYSDAINSSEAKRMFDHQLRENYGHAGDIYAKWLVENLEEAQNLVLQIQMKIDKELRLMPKERFWSAVVSANIAGGLIAKQLGLLNWDMKNLYKWASTMIRNLRDEIFMSSSVLVTPTEIIGDYINRHMNSILVVADEVDRRSMLAPLPLMEPRSELLIRYEPDTKRMFLAAGAFKKDCVQKQVNYRDTLNVLYEQGVYVRTLTKRLSKGMKVVAPPVHCIELNCNNSNFIDVDTLVEAIISGDRESQV